ncbi:NAD dependent epimerase/dehydratase family protein [Pseudomonas cuatrocienegasensis]|uniref:NAD dependent epimerase/dehydratase family protein n=1 Tax=Pseudomonas cuatrocienegasensis TaxID=543360 RepID=A0ABY1BDC0_9PSED|nr:MULTISPECIES: NAD(P)-dependent oxidoreductase [Pseudomonas]SEQ58836.1 NAD dependent epimerase/dehydratase family protein [Pseudomonas cuatrocienegasensis]
MKILVTGASGFIGGRFARFALEQGLTVRINGRRAEAVEALVERGAEFIQGDLSDIECVRRLCQGVDAVVHCAGAVGVWGPYAHFHQANVSVTENVIAACLSQGVRRLVQLSSPSVYFDGRAHQGLTENQVPQRFSDHYGKSRVCCRFVASRVAAQNLARLGGGRREWCSLAKSSNNAWRDFARNPKGRARFSAMLRFSMAHLAG